MASELESAFAEAWTDQATGSAPSVSAQQLQSLAEIGARAWPDFDVPLVHFARCAGVAVAAGAAIDKLRADEVWLAAGVAAKVTQAERAFDRDYCSDLPRVLARLRLDEAAIADAIQATREKLLVGRGRLPKIVSYAGRGTLGSLVRVVATRCGVDTQRAGAQQREVPAEELSAILVASADPERAAAFAKKSDEFRGAFERAIAQLEPDDRMALRLAAVDGIGIDGVAKALGIHRSTAARRLVRIRSTLGERTRAHLREAGLDSAELASVIAVVEEGLELTLSRMLAVPASAPAASDDPTLAQD